METSRDQEIVHSLVEIADNLIDDFDIVELLTGLTQRCVTLLGFSAAGVMLASPPGELRLGASSSDAMQVVELFELQANEGPCLDAFRTGQRVDCISLEEGKERWPQFAAVASAAGFRSVFALPLRLRDATIGALNLFSFEGSRSTENELIVAEDLPTSPPSASSSTGPPSRADESMNSYAGTRESGRHRTGERRHL